MVTQPKGLPKDKTIKWTSVGVQEVILSDYRLKASIYGIESRQVKIDLGTEQVGYCSFRFFY